MALINLGSTLPASEQDAQKVATYNNALNEVDTTLAGALTLSVAGNSNVILSRTQALNTFYKFTGALTGNIQVRWPASGGSARAFTVHNNTSGAFTLTLVVAGGTGVAITQSEIHNFVIDGTAVVPVNATTGTYTGVSAQAVWARVYHNAAQSIADSTLTAVAFNSERADTDTIHDTVTNNTRLTCKTAGVYSISFVVDFAINATGLRVVNLRLNGTTIIAGHSGNASSGLPTRLQCSTIYALAVNDYIEALVYQSSGGALNVESTANLSPEFMMARLGGS